MSSVTAQQIVRSAPRAWLVRGYMQAFDRFIDASQHRDSPEGMYMPLFEALNWAGTLEEKLRPHNDPFLLAIRFARNRVLHQWADAVEGRDVPFPRVTTAVGAGRPAGSALIAPPVIWEWFWRQVVELPAPPPAFADPVGEQHYDDLLAGKPVRAALETLRGIL